MDGTDWLWLVLGIVVIAALIVGAALATRRQRGVKERRSDALRDEATAQAAHVEQRENKAAEMQAHARAAQADAEAKAAEAERLSATAERQRVDVEAQRAEVDEQLRKADEMDPRIARDGRTPDDTAIDGEAVEDDDRVSHDYRGPKN